MPGAYSCNIGFCSNWGMKMKRIERFFAAMVACAILSGCGTVENYHAPDRVSADLQPGYGVVVISTAGGGRSLASITQLAVAQDGSSFDQNVEAELYVDNTTFKSDFADRRGIKLGALAQPLRAALAGSTASPPIFEVMAVLGPAETLARIGDVAPLDGGV